MDKIVVGAYCYNLGLWVKNSTYLIKICNLIKLCYSNHCRDCVWVNCDILKYL